MTVAGEHYASQCDVLPSTSGGPVTQISMCLCVRAFFQLPTNRTVVA